MSRPSRSSMPLRTRIFAAVLARTGTPIEEVPADDIATARALRASQYRHRLAPLIFGRCRRGCTVEDRLLSLETAELRVRVYRPKATDGALPIVLLFHGGGWVQGEPEQDEWLASNVAVDTGVVVVSVSYRLAPEHPYPAAVDDCWAATRWVYEHAASVGGDPHRMAVMGDSAGGNLAAVVAMLARDHHGEPGVPDLRLQVLIYPSVEMIEKFPSELQNANAPVLTASNMRAYSRLYLNGADGTAVTASPLRAESFAGLAPALIQTAELDPLLDNGWKYAEALADAGVPTSYTLYAGAIHGYISLPGVAPAARPALGEIITELRRALA